MLSNGTTRLLTGCAVLAVFGPQAVGAAPLSVSEAKIHGGELVVTGATPKARQAVQLDGEFRATSNPQRKFTFSLPDYHPDDCLVEVKAGAENVTAAVENCTKRGLRPRARWSAAAGYVLDDVVVHAGSSWRAKVANKGKLPDRNPRIWEKLVAKGDRGPPGQAGAPGALGAKGAQGDKGDRGVAGRMGNPGANGGPGSRGPQGPAGSNGILAVLPLDVPACNVTVPAGETRILARKDLTFTGNKRVTVSISVPVRLADGLTSPATMIYGAQLHPDAGQGTSYSVGQQRASAVPSWSVLTLSGSTTTDADHRHLRFYVFNESTVPIVAFCASGWVMVSE